MNKWAVTLTKRCLCEEKQCNNTEVDGDANISGAGEPELVGGAYLPDHDEGGACHTVDEVPGHPVRHVQVQHHHPWEGVAHLPGQEGGDGPKLAETQHEYL